LLPSKSATPKRRLAQFLLTDPEAILYHNEPIYCDGTRVGLILSGAYGHTLGGSVGMGYVNHTEGVTAEFLAGAHFEVQIANRRIPARVSLAPMYDPMRQRIFI
jgi:4-methylaminobutanoate oxidase (formaldehyde-forming)